MIRYRMAPFRKSPRPHPPLRRVILASKSCTCGSHLPSTTCKMCGNGSWRGGGWRGKPPGRLSTKQGNIVFWWFLWSYLTSRHSSYWYLLLFEQRIFWYYLGFQVMAILCCVAKNSLRGTSLFFPDRTEWCSLHKFPDFSCLEKVFYMAFVCKCTYMSKHRFEVPLLQNPP
jgi:hypothetical protein